jgi:hypothetical protein
MLTYQCSDTNDEEDMQQIGEAGQGGGRMPDEEAAGDPQCLDGKILTTERPEEPFG